MSKYAALRDHLNLRNGSRWIASFKEIEKILGFSLPKSARTYPAWWANQSAPGHVQCSGWMEAGWNTTDLNLQGQHVTFVKSLVSSGIAQQVSATRSRPEWSEVLAKKVDASRFAGSLEWHEVGPVALDSSNKIVFPKVPVGPAVYRFRLAFKGEQASYCGETDEISRRFQHYRTPGPTQRTNQWLNAAMTECLERDGKIRVDVLKADKLKVDGEDIAPDLACKFTRRLMENLAVTREKLTGCKVLNR